MQNNCATDSLEPYLLTLTINGLIIKIYLLLALPLCNKMETVHSFKTIYINKIFTVVYV